MFDHLRSMAIFQMVADLGSFRAAAKRLDLSPSIVSHHVTQLETRLGVTLLRRSTRRLRLTDAGEELLLAAKRMTQAADDGISAMHQRLHQPTGILRVSVAPGLAEGPFRAIFPRFARAYPKLRLELKTEDVVGATEIGAFDVALTSLVQPRDHAGYAMHPLGEMRLVAVATPYYARSHAIMGSLEGFADLKRVAYPTAPWMPAHAALPEGAPTRAPSVIARCESFDMAQAFVRDSLGFMVAHDVLVRDDLAHGRLVQILPDDALPSIQIYAVTPHNPIQNSAAEAFVDFATRHWLREGFSPHEVSSSHDLD